MEYGVEAGVVAVFNTVFDWGNICGVALFLKEVVFLSGRVDGAQWFKTDILRT